MWYYWLSFITTEAHSFSATENSTQYQIYLSAHTFYLISKFKQVHSNVYWLFLSSTTRIPQYNRTEVIVFPSYYTGNLLPPYI